MSETMTKPVEVERIPAHSWYALGVLTLVYVLNFLDRALVFIQLPLIRREFEFSDFQLGLLGSASFAIFYTLLGIPFGRLADRVRRKWLIAANFVLLAVALMWVGAAAADVHDIAGPHLRGLGVGIYFFTVIMAAYGVGGPLIGRVNDALGAGTNPQAMRYCLLLCPFASALAALLLWLGSRRLERGG